MCDYCEELKAQNRELKDLNALLSIENGELKDCVQRYSKLLDEVVERLKEFVGKNEGHTDVAVPGCED